MRSFAEIKLHLPCLIVKAVKTIYGPAPIKPNVGMRGNMLEFKPVRGSAVPAGDCAWSHGPLSWSVQSNQWGAGKAAEQAKPSNAFVLSDLPVFYVL
jgi:hypothetical protein